MCVRPLTLAAIALLLLAASMQAQQPATMPTLDQVLTEIRDEATAFHTSVPDLGADEHVVSSASGAVSKATNSVFRLRRAPASDHLTESREAIDTPAGSEQEIKGPSVGAGLFSSGTGDFSPDLKHCYNYQLAPKMQQLNHVAVVVVKYANKESLGADTGCPITDPVSGSAFVDPVTMQVLRVEQVLHLHELAPGEPGLWTWAWSIDYARTELGGKSFWLPQIITSRSSVPLKKRGTGMVDFKFVASYRNYHLLAVHSTILPTTTVPTP